MDRRLTAIRFKHEARLPDYDLLVAGELNPDLILADPGLDPCFAQQESVVESAELTIGSSSAIFACGAARLGLKVAFVGVVGNDLFGRFMLEALSGRGIDMTPVIVDPSQKTGLSVILSRRPAHAILTFLGAINGLRESHISDDHLRKARHLHVASYFLQENLRPGLPALFRRAHELGLTTSLDTNWDPEDLWTGLGLILPLTDLFLPNAAEARAITRTSDLGLAASQLADQGPVVAIKLGEDGAMAQRGGERVTCRAIPVAVTDTVGAGDSFDAGFVYGFIHGWDLERCLKLAVACGSLSVRAHGGTAAQPDLAEASAYL